MLLELPLLLALVAVGVAAWYAYRWFALRAELARTRSAVPVDADTGLLLDTVIQERLSMELRRARRHGGQLLWIELRLPTADATCTTGILLAEELRFPTTGFRLGPHALLVLAYVEPGAPAPVIAAFKGMRPARVVDIPTELRDDEITTWRAGIDGEVAA